MPQYSFIVDDDSFVASETMSLPDLVAARREAVIHIANLLKGRPGLLGLYDAINLQVRDAADKCLFVISIHIIAVAAED